MIIAVPCDDNDKICDNFEDAHTISFFTVENTEILTEKRVECFVLGAKARVDILIKEKAEKLLCHSLDNYSFASFKEASIEVVSLPKTSVFVENTLLLYLAGLLGTTIEFDLTSECGSSCSKGSCKGGCKNCR